MRNIISLLFFGLMFGCSNSSDDSSETHDNLPTENFVQAYKNSVDNIAFISAVGDSVVFRRGKIQKYGWSTDLQNRSYLLPEKCYDSFWIGVLLNGFEVYPTTRASDTAILQGDTYHVYKSEFGDTTYSGIMRNTFGYSEKCDVYGRGDYLASCLYHPFQVNIISDSSYNSVYSKGMSIESIMRITYYTPDIENHLTLKKEMMLSDFNELAPRLVSSEIHLQFTENPAKSGNYSFRVIVKSNGRVVENTVGPVYLEGKE